MTAVDDVDAGRQDTIDVADDVKSIDSRYVFKEGVNKNIVICCDGTWNFAEQKDDGRDAPTNVCKLYQAIDPERDFFDTPQLAWYDAGVGAELGLIGTLLSLAGRLLASKVPGLEKLGPLVEGATGLGVSENIREAYAWLCRVYAPGDRIFLFGFSRGAFQVRSLSGLIHTVGLLKSSAHNFAPSAFDKYEHFRPRDIGKADARGDTREPKAELTRDEEALFHDRDALRIHFLGVWDTVAGLGLPMWGWSFELFRIHTSFHNTTVVPCVDHACHAVAMDEHRSSFMPILLKPPANFKGQLEQKWFRGAHADIGGGYADSSLSDIALDWMMGKAEQAGLRLLPRRRGAPQPDPLGSLHDEAARTRAYAMAGLWPRMFPLSAALRGQIREHFGDAADNFDNVGEWHESVLERGARLAAEGASNSFHPTSRLLRLAQAPDKDAPALWDRSEPDPRDLEWQLVLPGSTPTRFLVYAERTWSPTGVVLIKDRRYWLREVGAGSDAALGVCTGKWFDLDDPANADGKNSLRTLWETLRKGSLLIVRFAFAAAKRYPDGQWFQLIGMINKPTHWDRRTLSTLRLLFYLLIRDPAELLYRQFPLGRNVSFVAKASGPFYCYANDLWLAAGNNSGAIEMEILDLGADSAAAPREAGRVPSEALLVRAMRVAQFGLVSGLAGVLAYAIYGLLDAALEPLSRAALRARLWPMEKAFDLGGWHPLGALEDSVRSAGTALGEAVAGVAMRHPALLWLAAGGLMLGLACWAWRRLRGARLRQRTDDGQTLPR